MFVKLILELFVIVVFFFGIVFCIWKNNCFLFCCNWMVILVMWVFLWVLCLKVFFIKGINRSGVIFVFLSDFFCIFYFILILLFDCFIFKVIKFLINCSFLLIFINFLFDLYKEKFNKFDSFNNKVGILVECLMVNL